MACRRCWRTRSCRRRSPASPGQWCRIGTPAPRCRCMDRRASTSRFPPGACHFAGSSWSVTRSGSSYWNRAAGCCGSALRSRRLAGEHTGHCRCCGARSAMYRSRRPSRRARAGWRSSIRGRGGARLWRSHRACCRTRPCARMTRPRWWQQACQHWLRATRTPRRRPTNAWWTGGGQFSSGALQLTRVGRGTIAASLSGSG